MLPQELKERFRRHIAERCGLYFKDHNLRDLERGVAARAAACGSAGAESYYGLLTDRERGESELRELLNLLTVNHTYFFRDERQFDALREKVLPEIIERKRELAARHGAKPALRVWSAGCSSGEEPYSIAILVRELLADLPDWNVSILATDVSQEALTKAAKAAYPESSLQHVPAEFRDRYFAPAEGGERALSAAVRDMVSFRYLNLMDEDYPCGWDVIFCRNVAIYFEFRTAFSIMARLHAALQEDGRLFIGYAETLQHMRDRYEMTCWKDGIFYRKRGGGVTSAAAEADKALEELSRAELAAETGGKAPPRPLQNALLAVFRAIRLNEYDTALKLVAEVQSLDSTAPAPYYHAAEVLLRLGKAGEAKKSLRDALKIDQLFAPAYYLLGCIAMDEDDPAGARECLRKALYIDKKFLMASFYLAQVFRNEGNARASVREYRNTINALLKAGQGDIIPYSGGFTAATLISVCRDNIERLKPEI